MSAPQSTGSQRARRGLQVLAFVLSDVAIVLISTLLAYWARFGGVVSTEFIGNVSVLAVVSAALFPALFMLFGLYHQLWRYASVDTVVRLGAATGIGFVLLVIADIALTPPNELRPVPIGVILIMSVFVFVGAAALRAFGRFASYLQAQGGGSAKRVLIIGAGDAGSLLLRDIENQPALGMRVVGFVDDDPRKQGRSIRGVRVRGTVDELGSIIRVTDAEEIFIATPSATDDERRRILNACAAADIPTRIIPSLALTEASPGFASLRNVSVEDLLGREPVPVDVDQIAGTITGKVVAVTGAAGSIGSELCRQIMTLDPAKLVMIEMDESRLYETYLQLRRDAPEVPEMVIADVRDRDKMTRILEDYRPSILLHAAAYKHVPLMQLAPDEAVKANVLGTRNVIEACEVAGVEHVVLISTDKAVHPRSVMGTTKAIAELLVLDAARRGRMRVTAVRFGNVLGSRGSVVPLFEEQLMNGGPLLVTHPEVTRYFMTIPEAARLVLQAQAISGGGEVFVLEMGEPVKIVDLARKMITLSGAHAEIEYVGLRPAEKLHETLVHDEHELLPTGCPKVLRANAIPLPGPRFEAEVNALIQAAEAGDSQRTKRIMNELVPGEQTDEPESGIELEPDEV